MVTCLKLRRQGSGRLTVGVARKIHTLIEARADCEPDGCSNIQNFVLFSFISETFLNRRSGSNYGSRWKLARDLINREDHECKTKRMMPIHRAHPRTVSKHERIQKIDLAEIRDQGLRRLHRFGTPDVLRRGVEKSIRAVDRWLVRRFGTDMP